MSMVAWLYVISHRRVNKSLTDRVFKLFPFPSDTNSLGISVQRSIPSIVASFILRQPNEIEATSNPRELNIYSLYGPISMAFILLGSVYLLNELRVEEQTRQQHHQQHVDGEKEVTKAVAMIEEHNNKGAAASETTSLLA